jgi:hypothetical protein
MSSLALDDCIQACHACALACDRCAAACLAEADPKAMARCIALDMDCADMCRLAAAMMARQSSFVHSMCELCAVVCKACAQECSRHPMDHCSACAQACTRCARECERMTQPL